MLYPFGHTIAPTVSFLVLLDVIFLIDFSIKASDALHYQVGRVGADAIRVRDNINYTVGNSNLALCKNFKIPKRRFIRKLF